MSRRGDLEQPIDIRGELRAVRPQPGPEFMSSVVDRVRVEHPRAVVARRTALALAATATAVGVFAGFGGISQATSTITTVVSKVVHMGSPPPSHRPMPPKPPGRVPPPPQRMKLNVPGSPSGDQYCPPRTHPLQGRACFVR
jgi:hypothetical protein